MEAHEAPGEAADTLALHFQHQEAASPLNLLTYRDGKAVRLLVEIRNR